MIPETSFYNFAGKTFSTFTQAKRYSTRKKLSGYLFRITEEGIYSAREIVTHFNNSKH